MDVILTVSNPNPLWGTAGVSKLQNEPVTMVIDPSKTTDRILLQKSARF